MDEEKKNSLLIVDDEKKNLQILTHILGQEYTIYTATNGTSAISIARKYKPDLILLDIVMHTMDGYRTLSEIKGCEHIKMIPVVFITGLRSTEDEEKGLSLGAADYITKPLNAMIVKLRVRNQIQIINQFRTIEHMSMTDQLTNIPNRRSFDERLYMEWKHVIREKIPISILIIDIDKFKHINDTYGHLQGDIVLKTIVKVFQQSVRRPRDFTARWGGEEFVVLLPNTPLDGSLYIAEKLRADIENTLIHLENDSTVKVTVSIGVNTQEPEQDSSVDDFISVADRALYTAKSSGRNRVFHPLSIS